MYDTERTPWELVQVRGQVAGETETVAYGGESPWYVGQRYIADAGQAAKLRKIEQQREQERAARRAAYLERRAAVAVAS